MRAKSVNEEVNFERGKNPKTTMGIGGLKLYDKVEELMEEMDYEIGQIKFGTDEAWEEYVRETLIGKTITAKMRRLPQYSKNPQGGLRKRAIPAYEEFTIKVTDIVIDRKPSDEYDDFRRGYLNISVLVTDGNDVYELKSIEKISIN